MKTFALVASIAAVATATMQGATVVVDPAIITLWTVLIVPGGGFVVVSTAKAVRLLNTLVASDLKLDRRLAHIEKELGIEPYPGDKIAK